TPAGDGDGNGYLALSAPPHLGFDVISIPEVQNRLHAEILQEKVAELINAYRIRGHLFANLDPLGLLQPPPPELEIEHFGLSDAVPRAEAAHPGPAHRGRDAGDVPPPQVYRQEAVLAGRSGEPHPAARLARRGIRPSGWRGDRDGNGAPRPPQRPRQRARQGIQRALRRVRGYRSRNDDGPRRREVPHGVFQRPQAGRRPHDASLAGLQPEPS